MALNSEFRSAATFSFRKCWLVEEISYDAAKEVDHHQPLAVYLDERRARDRAYDEGCRDHRHGAEFIVSQLWLEESIDLNGDAEIG